MYPRTYSEQEACRRTNGSLSRNRLSVSCVCVCVCVCVFFLIRLCNPVCSKVYAMKSMLKEHMILKNQVTHVKAERDVMAEADDPWIVKLMYSFQVFYIVRSWA